MTKHRSACTHCVTRLFIGISLSVINSKAMSVYFTPHPRGTKWWIFLQQELTFLDGFYDNVQIFRLVCHWSVLWIYLYIAHICVQVVYHQIHGEMVETICQNEGRKKKQQLPGACSCMLRKPSVVGLKSKFSRLPLTAYRRSVNPVECTGDSPSSSHFSEITSVTKRLHGTSSAEVISNPWYFGHFEMRLGQVAD